MQPLPRKFYQQDTKLVAKQLLGCFLVHKQDGIERIGKIVEVEAYLGEHDLAAHSSKGLTPRTKVMFGPPGYAYVYLIYGIHHCINVVTEKAGIGAAVLIRALEPVQNLNARTQGPGLLTKAMGITRALNCHDLLSKPFFISKGENPTPEFVAKPRIGVSYAKDWADKPLRFYIVGNSYISKL